MARVINYDAIGLSAKALDYSMLRHKVLTDNIANIDTPGFKRSDVSFVSELKRALDPPTRIEMSRISARHFDTEPTRDIDRINPNVYAELDTWTRNDKNNVDPEVEMANMAQNTMYYQTMSDRFANRFRVLSSIVNKTQSA